MVPFSALGQWILQHPSFDKSKRAWCKCQTSLKPARALCGVPLVARGAQMACSGFARELYNDVRKQQPNPPSCLNGGPQSARLVRVQLQAPARYLNQESIVNQPGAGTHQ